MTMPAFSAETRALMVGWRLISAYQMPQPDGRKLKRCPEPSDPWCISLCNHRSVLLASRLVWGQGETLDDAVRDALGNTAPSFREALSRYEAAADELRAAYRRRYPAISAAWFSQRCSMGVGCDEVGVCYAEAHGEPDRCPLLQGG